MKNELGNLGSFFYETIFIVNPISLNGFVVNGENRVKRRELKLMTYKLIIPLVTILFFLMGCNTSQENASPPPENVTFGQDDIRIFNNDWEHIDSNVYQFQSFDLEVEYDHNKSFEAEYENERDGVEAKIEGGKFTNTLTKDEALDELRPRFEELTFTPSTPDHEVISQVLQVFELNEDFKEFELEVKYSDGSEKEYTKRS